MVLEYTPFILPFVGSRLITRAGAAAPLPAVLTR